MVTRITSIFEIGGYSFDVAVAKRREGDIPLFGTVRQIQTPSGELDTKRAKGVEPLSFLLRNTSAKIQATWGLNTNPLVRIVAGLPLNQFMSFVDFPAFYKNSILGVRFNKEQLGQSSPWIYGVTQYPVPRLEEKRTNILVEGYGLLFEAPRRHDSRNFKTATAKSIIASIAKKYGLGFGTVGNLPDRTPKEPEQNSDDFFLLNRMAAILDAFWFLEENNLFLVGRNQMYSQKPEVTLLYGRQSTKDIGTHFPVYEFTPLLDAQSFEAGAIQITGRGIDLDTGEIIEKVFRPRATRLGAFSLNSNQFFSDEGVTINGRVVRPAPKLRLTESGVFLPLKFRSDDEARYLYFVEQKDVEVRAIVTTPGIPRLKPGMMVRMDGVGEFFGGNWIVEEVDHLIGDGKGFITTLSLMRNALGNVRAPAPFKTNLSETPERETGGVQRFAEIVE